MEDCKVTIEEAKFTRIDFNIDSECSGTLRFEPSYKARMFLPIAEDDPTVKLQVDCELEAESNGHFYLSCTIEYIVSLDPIPADRIKVLHAFSDNELLDYTVEFIATSLVAMGHKLTPQKQT